MKEKNVVPYYIFEGEMIRAERFVKRMITALVAVSSLLVVNNLLWIRYTRKAREYETEDQN